MGDNNETLQMLPSLAERHSILQLKDGKCGCLRHLFHCYWCCGLYPVEIVLISSFTEVA